MKMPLRILLTCICAALILILPFVLSSPDTLEHIKLELMNGNDTEEDEGEEIDFGRLFLSAALAEDSLEVVTSENGALVANPDWKLPIDFSVSPIPNPACYTADGYADETIRVKVETRDIDGKTVDIAWVQIADPTQLRTAIAGEKVTSSKTVSLADIASRNRAVIAMNGDLFIQLPEKKKFEFRMGQKIRGGTNKKKDTLIIDRNGDFHLFVKSVGLADYAKAHKDEIVNAFMFGPALVIDGKLQKTDTDYGYAPNYKNPRSAIGQTGTLSYVMVIVEGRGKEDSESGVTHQELAQIMYDLGCIQAYNLDGGNTAEMIMPEGYENSKPGEKFHFNGDQTASDRGQSDIIYFATAVPESMWK